MGLFVALLDSGSERENVEVQDRLRAARAQAYRNAARVSRVGGAVLVARGLLVAGAGAVI